jgi:Xaa-Pro aminopeptidase
VTLTVETLPDFQRAVADAELDGWLLFDFRGINPVARDLLRLEGMATRRVFAWVPARGTPTALTHAIEQGPWVNWPKAWNRDVYSSWRSLEAWLGKMVSGKRVAMETSPGDAVPYIDRIPAGVLEMVRAAGADVRSSGELVSRFYAQWTDADIASHTRAAEQIAPIARQAFALAGRRARAGNPMTEHDLMRWIQAEFAKLGLTTDHGPNVSAGPNAANPHYEPAATHSRLLAEGEIVLIDLWAKEVDGVYADQTWMASIGEPSAEARKVWEAVRDARDAAIDTVRTGVRNGAALRGADVDDVARDVIVSRGYGEYFTHRTGHSIDARELHGSGPHLDNLETREERRLIAGVGFSIEPGVYIPGKIGMRSEVNVYLQVGKAVVTPAEYQRELIVV